MVNIRKKPFWAIIIVCACLLCACSVTYAWLSYTTYSGRMLEYRKSNVQIAGVLAEIHTYYGVESGVEGGAVRFDDEMPDTGIDFENVVPGERRYYKTTVKNLSETVGSYFSVHIVKATYDVELTNYLSIHVTNPTNTITDFTDGTDYYDDVEGKDRKYLGDIAIAENQYIGAGKTIEIYWFVSFDEEAPNSCMEKKVHLDALQIIV